MTSPRNQKTEVRDQRSEGGRQRSEIRGRRSEDRGRRSEVGGQKAEGRSRRAEVGGQKREIRSRRSGVSSREGDLQSLIGEAYERGVAAHGDIGLTLEDFAEHLTSIIAKRFGAEPRESAVGRFAAGPHIEDLFLAAACVRKSDAAWERLAALYKDHIHNVAHATCSTHQEARELTSSLLAHLLFSGHTGQSRIASYDGRGSLRGWLATIIKHQAMNRRQLKSTEALPLDSLRHTPSDKGPSEMEASLMNGKYKEAITDSFTVAVASLSEREKRVLVLELEDDLSAAEIARMLGVHKAQMTRVIHRAQDKLRLALFNRLGSHHGLTADAMEECAAHILRNPEASLAVFLLAAA